MEITGFKVLMVVIAIVVIVIIVILLMRFFAVDHLEAMRRNEDTLTTLTQDIQPTNRLGCPVIYINLDRSPERREFMEDQLKRFNIKYGRMRGIDGKTLDMNRGEIKDYFDKPVRYENSYTTITRSELGCTLSHLCAVKAAYELNYDQVIIFEDDLSLNLVPLWTKSLPERIKDAPEGWEILQLFSYDKEVDIKTTFHKCAAGKYYWSCAAYLINRKGMRSVLNASFHDNTFTLGEQSYDGLADIFIYESSKGTYVCSVPLFYPANDHKSMNSTIHTGHTEFHIRRSKEMIDYYLTLPFFHEKGNSYHDLFIEKLFMRKLQEMHFPSSSSIVVFAAPSPNIQPIINNYQDNYVLIVDGEPHDISNLKGANLIITTKKNLRMKDGTPTVYVPLYAFNVYGFKTQLKLYSLEELVKSSHSSQAPQSKKKFCCFMFSNCDEKQEGVKFRKELLDKLQERSGGRVDILGKCYNPTYKDNGTHLNSVDIFREYKFTIAVENSFLNGYMSEKIVNPMIAGSIPIYMGAPDVGEDFDTNSFVHVRDYENIDRCVDAIMRLDEDDALYAEKFTHPWFLNNKIPKHSTLEAIRDSVRPYISF